MLFHFFTSINKSILDSLKEFTDNLQPLLDKISNQELFLTVVLGDFNTKSSNWYKHDKTISDGSKIDVLTSQFGLEQLIKEPTHILGNSSSYIDLIFISHSKPSYGVGRSYFISFKLSP